MTDMDSSVLYTSPDRLIMNLSNMACEYLAAVDEVPRYLQRAIVSQAIPRWYAWFTTTMINHQHQLHRRFFGPFGVSSDAIIDTPDILKTRVSALLQVAVDGGDAAFADSAAQQLIDVLAECSAPEKYEFFNRIYQPALYFVNQQFTEGGCLYPFHVKLYATIMDTVRTSVRMTYLDNRPFYSHDMCAARLATESIDVSMPEPQTDRAFLVKQMFIQEMTDVIRRMMEYAVSRSDTVADVFYVPDHVARRILTDVVTVLREVTFTADEATQILASINDADVDEDVDAVEPEAVPEPVAAVPEPVDDPTTELVAVSPLVTQVVASIMSDDEAIDAMGHVPANPVVRIPTPVVDPPASMGYADSGVFEQVFGDIPHSAASALRGGGVMIDLAEVPQTDRLDEVQYLNTDDSEGSDDSAPVSDDSTPVLPTEPLPLARALDFTNISMMVAPDTQPVTAAPATQSTPSFVLTQSEASVLFPHRYRVGGLTPSPGCLITCGQVIHPHEMYVLDLLRRTYPRGMSESDKGPGDVSDGSSADTRDAWNHCIDSIAEAMDELFPSRPLPSDFDLDRAIAANAHVSVYVIPDPIVLSGKAV